MPTKPTTKKSATARANGAKSHGPSTAAGRARSSQNALRHGLAAEFTRGAIRRRAALPTVSVVLDDESPADFELLLDSYLDEFAPTSPIEVELIETMVSARWRLRRLANIETKLLDNEMETSIDDIHHFFADVDREPDVEDHLAYAFKRLADGASLHLLLRYEGTLSRSYTRAFKQLQQLQALRNRAQPNEPKQSLPVAAPEFTRGEFTRGATGDRVRRPGPIPPNRSDDKTSPAPPPVLQTPPSPKSLPVEPVGDRVPARQIPPPPSQPATMQNPTCK